MAVDRRIYQNFTERTKLLGRFAFSQSRYPDGTISLTPYQGLNTGENTRNQNLNLTLTHSFSSNFFSETRAVYNRVLDVQPLGKAPATTPC